MFALCSTANQLNIVKFFICDSIKFSPSFKMDINLIDYGDQTCLHIAIERSYIEMVKYLLKCPDLNISLKDSKNRTYLHYSGRLNHYKF